MALFNGLNKIGNVSSGKMKASGQAMDKFGGMGKKGELLKKVFTDIYHAINPLQPVITAISDIFSIWGEVLGAAFMPLVEKLYEVMLSPAVMSALNSLGEAFGMVVDALLPVIDALAPIIPLIMQALTIPLQILAPILEALSPLFVALLSPLNLLKPILDLLTPALEYLNPVIEGIGIVANLVASAINTAVGWIMDIINSLTPPGPTKERIGAIEEVSPELGGFLRDIIEELFPGQTIPAFANGGYIDTPQIAMIGEKGPEFIIPESEVQTTDLNRSVTINVYGNVTEDRLMETQKQAWLASIR